MTNLQSLENDIRKSLPELKNTNIGSYVEINNMEFQIVDRNGTVEIPVRKSLKYRNLNEFENYEIIGQEIQLIHVLKWLDNKVGMWNYIHGHVYFSQHLLINWNLYENLLKNQSKELIDFLFNLIQK